MSSLPECIIGLFGDGATGKDFIAAKIAQRGFITVSASTIVREEIYRRGLVPNRELQTQVANEVREARGGEYFVACALKRAREAAQAQAGRILISGIYAPSEGQYLKEQQATLIHVKATHSKSSEDDLAFRYSRLAQRSDGTRDELTIEQFLAAHQRENGGRTPLHANVSSLASLADIELVNDGSPDLEQRLTLILERMEQRVES